MRQMVTERLYLDYAASTPLDPRVKLAMEPYWMEKIGNAGALHAEGREAKAALEEARQTVADVFGSRPDEVIFTSGGTESNALALFGTVKHYDLEHKGDLSRLHVITTAIEHPSVIDGLRELEERGARLDIIGVDHRGIIDLKALERVLTRETFLVSVMYVNNEIGSIQPIQEVAKLVRKMKKQRSPQENLSGTTTPYLHTDASQAPLYLPVRVDALGVDLLTVDAQKIYGPKASGALYIRRGVNIRGLFRGGKQERGLRPGTPPTPMVVGMAVSLKFAETEREEVSAKVREVQDYFIDRALAELPGVELNGDRHERLPNNVNLSFPGFESEFLILALDARGVACAARSACIDQGEGSYVVASLGKSKICAVSSLRFSLGKATTKTEADRTIDALKEILASQPNLGEAPMKPLHTFSTTTSPVRHCSAEGVPGEPAHDTL
jgi:cysteine desulfurase